MDLDGTKVSFIETFLGAERTSGLWWLCDPLAQQRELVPVMLARDEMVWKDCLERKHLARLPFTKNQGRAPGCPVVISAHYEAEPANLSTAER